jgi:hypothetical protein
MARLQVASDLTLRELQTLLDQELQRLPEKYKSPFVLCCLEGKSKSEAASELGWKVGTVSSRLACARKSLQMQLVRRGVSLSAVLAATALATGVSKAAVPRVLIDNTVKAALYYGTRKGALGGVVSAQVASLVRAVSQSMAVGKFKSVLALVLGLGLAATGIGTLSHQLLAEPNHQEAAEAQPAFTDTPTPEPNPASRPAPTQDPDRRPIIVTGRVLDPSGKPVVSARVGVLTQHPVDAGEGFTGGPWLRLDKTDDKGGFRFTLERPLPKSWSPPIVVAESPGFGVAWQPIDQDVSEADVLLHLPSERLVSGRVLDAQGKPAAGARVQVAYVSAPDGRRWLLPVHPRDRPGRRR